MDNGLLASETHVELIRSQIALGLYMQTNETPDVSKSILLEALKAYVQGQIISYSAQLVCKPSSISYPQLRQLN